LSDGLTVPFALTAGLSGLGTSRIVVVGGLAELIAGAISMGIGGFLASQAERDHYRFLQRHTYSRVMRSCIGEMEREVYAVLGPVGVDETTSQAVTNCLRKIEDEPGFASTSTHADEENASRGMKSDSGLTPFLLKFGEGLGMCLLLLFCVGRGSDCPCLLLAQRKFRLGGYTSPRLPSAWVTFLAASSPFSHISSSLEHLKRCNIHV
jgi:hypothetical protein